MYKVGIITASDKGSIGEREDLSGALIAAMIKENGYELVEAVIVPDDEVVIYETICHMADALRVHLILTTGGTGFSQRDVTPEATLRAVERRAPGIAEAIRYNSLKITPKGMLSRGESGIRGKTLIVNLPGSPKAVKESLEYILAPIHHGIQILVGDDSECARPL